MDGMNHDHHQASDPHAGHTMSDNHGSHDRHAGHSVAMFRDKFWLSLALTIPVVFWSTDVQHWLGYAAPSFPGSKFIPATLGTVVFVYGGLVFIRGAGSELAILSVPPRLARSPIRRAASSVWRLRTAWTIALWEPTASRRS